MRLGPEGALIGTVGLAALVLMLPVVVPIGPMYWDVAVYVDASQRMTMGQAPNVDFFAPVGPLAYYAYHWLARLFGGHPLLTAQFSMLLIAAPIMFAVLLRSRGEDAWKRWALVVLFAFFALLPFNTRLFSAFPGVDGFGIYNRHGALLLYVLASVLLFARGGWGFAFLVAATMTALFLLKITAFLAGGLLCVVALLTGRVAVRSAVAAVLLFAGALGYLELTRGLVSAYAADLLVLGTMNGGGQLFRLLQGGSVWIGVLLPGAALVALVARRGRLFSAVSWWLAGGLAAGLFYESQNTGSLGFIHMIPIVLRFAPDLKASSRRTAPILVALMLVPPIATVATSAVRAIGGMIRHDVPDLALAGPYGRVSAKPETVERAEAMRRHYAEHRSAYRDLASRDLLPGADTYAEHDFQVLQIATVASAVKAIRAIETRPGVRFERMFALNFVNPYPAALGRGAPRHVSIGADPSRTVPPPDAATLEEVRQTDLVLRPTCPVTSANDDLLAFYGSALLQHVRVELTPCTEAWVHPRFSGLIPSATPGSR